MDPRQGKRYDLLVIGEDFTDRSVVEGAVFVDPFKSGFDLASVGL